MPHNIDPSLTAVLHGVVLSRPGGLDARTIADLVGKPYQTLMAELSRQEGHKLGADLLLPLLRVCDTDIPLHFLARERGGVFLRTPEPAEGGSELACTLATSAKEYAEFMRETAESISDGQIPREQLDRINKEGQEAVEAIMAMMRLARVTHEAQYGGKQA
jgi:hypothetical protein